MTTPCHINMGLDLQTWLKGQHLEAKTSPGKTIKGNIRLVNELIVVIIILSILSFSKEFREGGRILMQKLQKYKPRIAAFNGKCEELLLLNGFFFCQ